MKIVKRVGAFFLWQALCFGVAALGSMFTSMSVHGWYVKELVKPAWTPSGSVIGTVWTVLYALLALAYVRRHTQFFHRSFELTHGSFSLAGCVSTRCRPGWFEDAPVVFFPQGAPIPARR